jgi:hypothetical protein
MILVLHDFNLQLKEKKKDLKGGGKLIILELGDP